LCPLEAPNRRRGGLRQHANPRRQPGAETDLVNGCGSSG